MTNMSRRMCDLSDFLINTTGAPQPFGSAVAELALPLAHLGTAKAQPFGLFPHTSGRPDPTERLHTIAGPPREPS
jgi:hypothetical protein